MSVSVYPPLRLVAPSGDTPATILVVEDDEPIRLALREVLEVEGYQVIVAADGEEAIRALESDAGELPALIVTDLQMPNVDGAQLCAHLRSHARTEQIPIIVLTAEHRCDKIMGQVDALIRKPFDIDALLATIAQFIRPTLLPRAPAAPPSVRLSLKAKKHSFTLYVSGGSSASQRAERTVRSVLEGRPLEVIDILADPSRARVDGIAMTPSLIRSCNGQREVFLGDLSEPTLVEEFASGS